MMISPMVNIEKYKKMTINELVVEKKELMASIADLEKNSIWWFARRRWMENTPKSGCYLSGISRRACKSDYDIKR